MDDPFIGFTANGVRFDRLLGKGGMGSVYLGVQLNLNRTVAVKVIAPHLVADPRHVERFTREAQTLGRLVHPNIIACHDFGPGTGPRNEPLYLMVLEYVDGWSLGTLSRTQRLSVRQVLELHAQAAEGLAFAHQLGVVHRDVKPDNIMVTRQGQAKLADFGLARTDDSVQVTQTGAIIGSPAYLSPEACRGEPPTLRSDLYSLGCSLFQLLTDRPPYPGASTLQVIQQHVGDPIPALTDHRPDLPRLEAVLRRLLAKSPLDRYPDATVVAATLRAEASQVPEGLVAGRIRRVTGQSSPMLAATQVSGVATASTAGPRGSARRLSPWTTVSQRRVALMSGLGAILALMLVAAFARRDRAENPEATGLLSTAQQQLREGQPEAAAKTLTRLTGVAALAPSQERLARALGQQIDQVRNALAEEALRRAEGLVEQSPEAALAELARQPIPPALATRAKQISDRAEAVLAATAAEGIRQLTPLEGEVLTGWTLPPRSPLSPQGIHRSATADGEQRLRIGLPPNAGGEIGVYVATDKATTLRLRTSTGRTLTSTTTENRDWQLVTAALTPAAEHLDLVASEVIYLAAAVIGPRTPRLGDLNLIPGTLENLHQFRRAMTAAAGNRKGPIDLANLRLILPRTLVVALPEGGSGFAAVVSRGLLGASGRIGSDRIITYDVRQETLRRVLEAVPGSHVVVLLAPDTMLAAVTEAFYRKAIDAGTLPILIRTHQAARANRPRRQAVADERDKAGPAIIDLDAVAEFHSADESPWESGSPAAIRANQEALEAALGQLRTLLLAGPAR